MAVLRGRYALAGRPGLRGVTLDEFCDVIWAEIWDDCAPMGDRSEYRRIMLELFIEGKPAHTIWYTDGKGKKKRLANPPAGLGSSAVPDDEMSKARAMRDQMLAAQAKAKTAAKATDE